MYLIIYKATRVYDGVCEGFAVNEVLLGLALPDQDVPVAQIVERIALISATHAGDKNHLLHTGLLGSIDLCFLPQPVNLHSMSKLGSLLPR